jgi:hypothetical protein
MLIILSGYRNRIATSYRQTLGRKGKKRKFNENEEEGEEMKLE